MKFNPKQHFQHACNQRLVHIEQLRVNYDNAKDAVIRRRLLKKIEREEEQLAVIREIWAID